MFGNDYPTPDGTGVRDYIHVVDLAIGHLKALARIASDTGVFTYNLGTGQGYSVLEMIKAFEAASGRTIPTRSSPVARRHRRVLGRTAEGPCRAGLAGRARPGADDGGYLALAKPESERLPSLRM